MSTQLTLNAQLDRSGPTNRVRILTVGGSDAEYGESYPLATFIRPLGREEGVERSLTRSRWEGWFNVGYSLTKCRSQKFQKCVLDLSEMCRKIVGYKNQFAQTLLFALLK